MEIGDFDYALPPELIAQTPVEPRDSSRLLVAHRATGALEHRVFAAIGDYLRSGDLLVANQSRVLPARLRGEQRAEPSTRRRSGLANYAQLLNALCEWMRLSTHG